MSVESAAALIEEATLASEELVALADILQAASVSDAPPEDGTAETIAAMIFNRGIAVRRYLKGIARPSDPPS